MKLTRRQLSAALALPGQARNWTMWDAACATSAGDTPNGTDGAMERRCSIMNLIPTKPVAPPSTSATRQRLRA